MELLLRLFGPKYSPYLTFLTQLCIRRMYLCVCVCACASSDICCTLLTRLGALVRVVLVGACARRSCDVTSWIHCAVIYVRLCNVLRTSMKLGKQCYVSVRLFSNA